MIPSLEQLIVSKIDESYKDKVEFANSKDVFSKSINICLDKILLSLDIKYKEQFKKITSVNWTNFVKVQDILPCMQTALKIIKQTIINLEENLHPTYFKAFTNKIAISIPLEYLNTVFTIKKCNEESSQ